ncbi:isopentenyl-diphosphate delta-isomerase, partial [Mycobacterium sp. ITM-2017-0098]
FCGHPGPGESVAAAVHRRGREELGARLVDVDCVLPEFRYRAQNTGHTSFSTVPSAACARVDGAVAPVPTEVMDLVWVSWDEIRAAATLEWAISPWARR